MFISDLTPKIINIPQFQYDPNQSGGTEYMAKNVLVNILPDLPKFKNYDCIVIPGIFDHKINTGKQRLIWLHNYPYEFFEGQIELLKSIIREERTKYVIAVSETQKKRLVDYFELPEEKIYVLPNAIYPLPTNLNKFNNVDNIELIHLSSPERGMEILLTALKYTKKEFILRIFNSYYPGMNEEFKDLIDDNRVIFYGKTPQKTLFKYFANAHIHAYPSTHPETFCLSQVEAMSAGCLNVFSTPENASLTDITNGFGINAKLGYNNLEEDAKKFAKSLDQAIDLIKSNKFNPEEEISYANNTFSWEAAKENWTKFHELL
jgi:glycosyltransferase involved in cell wall biosynthesis